MGDEGHPVFAAGDVEKQLTIDHSMEHVERRDARAEFKRVDVRRLDRRVGDEVVPVAPGEMINVTAGAADEDVVARATAEMVVSFAARQGVVAPIALQVVAAFAAVEAIVAFTAGKRVVATCAEDRVVAAAAGNSIIHDTAQQAVTVVASREQPRSDLGSCPARAIGKADLRQRQARTFARGTRLPAFIDLDPTRDRRHIEQQRTRPAGGEANAHVVRRDAVAKLDRVVAGPDHTTGHRIQAEVPIEVVGVDAIAAAEPVVARTTFEPVVAGVAVEGIVFAAAKQRITPRAAAEQVPSGTARHAVVAPTGEEHIITGAAIDRVAGGRADQRVAGARCALVMQAREGIAAFDDRAVSKNETRADDRQTAGRIDRHQEAAKRRRHCFQADQQPSAGRRQGLKVEHDITR